MKDFMIDLETLSTSPRAGILSLAIVEFGRDGEVGRRLYARFGYDRASSHGEVSDSTLEWWGKQDADVREEAFKRVHSVSATLDVIDTLIDKNSLVWGNGSHFDITILENLYATLGKQVPWKFWNVRDVRTVADITGINIWDEAKNFEGAAHNPLDDCLHQIKYVTKGLKRLTVNKE